MSDGTIIIDTRIDQSGADAGMRKLQNKLDSATQAARKQAEAVRALELEYQKWSDAANDVKLSGGAVSPELQAGLDAAGVKLEEGRTKLEQLSIAAGEARMNLDKALNPEQPALFAGATAKAEKEFNRFSKRLSNTFKSALVFAVLYKGLSILRNYMSGALKTNTEFMSSLATLKGNLLTAFQPIWNVIVPALTRLIQLLATAAAYLAKFFALLGGTSVKASAASAESLYNEANAMDAAGGSAKDAGKQMASFDEINKLSDTEAGGGGSAAVNAADFDNLDAAGSKMKDLLATVAAIAGGLATWKIASSFGASLKTAAGLAVAVSGAILLITGYIDAWNNGIDWTNFAEILEGLTLLAIGLGIAFGPTAAAISLIAGGIALLVLGFKDLTTNGMSLQNVLLIIAGLFAAGLGIGILTGSWIPILIAAFLSLIVAALAVSGNFEEFIALGKQLFSDFVGFFQALVSGDWAGAWEYAGKIVDDFGAMLKLIWESLKTAFNTLCDQLIEKVGGTNTAIGGLIDALREIFNGIVTFIEGVFSGDWQKAWNGITGIFKGIVNGIIALFEGMINFIIDGINWLIGKLNSISITMPDWVEDKFGIGSIGFDISAIEGVTLPRLAAGAVIPPNREFMAVLGDQKSGTNIEAPLGTLVEAFRQANQESGGGNITIKFEGSLAQLGRMLQPVVEKESRRRGPKLVST